jgi:1-acyl-sn-glycerol-3-phosphate acyltransferase
VYSARSASGRLPTSEASVWLFRLFRWYAARYVRKHFHAVRMSKGCCVWSAGPVLIVMNHPSWWDPMIGLVLSRAFADADQYAAIDAVAGRKYGFLSWLGFIGVESARDFLRTGEAILSEPNRVYWVTAQGRFSDVRERPLNLRPGVGHLAARMKAGCVLPIAVEYTFWTERTPEALVRIGEPLRIKDHPGLRGKEWSKLIEEALTRTLDQLNAETASRDPSKFVTLLEGRSGVGGVYDVWRRLKAWSRGRKFDPAHGGDAR